MEKKLRRNVRRYSPRVALAALGLKIRSQGLLDPVKQKVVILRKSIRNTPTQKLRCDDRELCDQSPGVSCAKRRLQCR